MTKKRRRPIHLHVMVSEAEHGHDFHEMLFQTWQNPVWHAWHVGGAEYQYHCHSKATSRKGPAFQESWNRWLACGPQLDAMDPSTHLLRLTGRAQIPDMSQQYIHE